MRSAWALARRWWPVGYLALCAFEIVSVWLGNWPRDAKVDTTILAGGIVGWFLLWRAERHSRLRAERLADRARKQGTEPCGACQHYACDGVDCFTCDGPCTRPGLTRPIDDRAYWLN